MFLLDLLYKTNAIINRPNGEFSPNLVTLKPMAAFKKTFFFVTYEWAK